jgi:hypothetical protein
VANPDDDYSQKLKEYFSYDPCSGEIMVFKTRRRSQTPIGQPVKSTDTQGYYILSFQYKILLQHRVAWYFHYGEWPQRQIDHINRDKKDNRIENLREVGHRENAQNTENFNSGARKPKG